MKTNRSYLASAKALLVACALSALAIASANAVVVTWDFNPGNQNGNAGTNTLTFTQSGYDLTVRGYDNVSGPDTLHELYYKDVAASGGAAEHGLGLVGVPDNEFGADSNGTPLNYLQLDLRSILAANAMNGMVQVTSLQAGEGFAIFGSNSLGQLGTQLGGSFVGTAFDGQFVAIPDFGSFQFISIAATSGDILPTAFRATFTPIPEMSALFPILGLLAAVSATQILRRRRAARAGETSA
ncbi:MAG: hypothetical protein ABI946_00900 [Chthoniobacterales bacterium]